MQKFFTVLLVAREANERGEESHILYMVSNRLSDASDIENALKIAVESISRLMQVNVGCIYLGKQGEKIYIQQVKDRQVHRNISEHL